MMWFLWGRIRRDHQLGAVRGRLVQAEERADAECRRLETSQICAFGATCSAYAPSFFSTLRRVPHGDRGQADHRADLPLKGQYSNGLGKLAR